MTPTADLSILSLITKATVVVQFVMLLLAVLSIASWTAIFQKGFAWASVIVGLIHSPALLVVD